MKPLQKRLLQILLIVSGVVLMTSCQDDGSEILEETCIAEIYDETWPIYAYKKELQSIVFEDSLGLEYKFSLERLDSSFIKTGAGAGELGENYEHLLYNEKLDFYLEVKLWGHTLQSPCISGEAFQNIISAQGPMKDVWVSEDGQSNLSIIIRRNRNGLEFQNGIIDIDSLVINNKLYENVYVSDEDIKIYYTIANGVVGIVDPGRNLKVTLLRIE